MQDDLETMTVAPRPRRSGAGLLVVTLLGFIFGAALAGYLVWHGDLAAVLPPRNGAQDANTTQAPQPANAIAANAPQADVSGLETRLALMEDRFSRLSFAADAAAGDATRAEGLLIATSARRLIDRGQPLGFVADQLRLRFGDAQPRAVQTIAEFARNPVTMDELTARLEALAPDLTNAAENLSLWERLRQEFAGLFVVRRDSSTLLAPAARVQRAKLMIAAGRMSNAIDEVQRLPGADHADKWIEDARRYDDAQRALDLIETAAMLEPRKLKDGEGQSVTEPSPLAAPANVAATPSPSESASPAPSR